VDRHKHRGKRGGMRSHTGDAGRRDGNRALRKQEERVRAEGEELDEHECSVQRVGNEGRDPVHDREHEEVVEVPPGVQIKRIDHPAELATQARHGLRYRPVLLRGQVDDDAQVVVAICEIVHGQRRPDIVSRGRVHRAVLAIGGHDPVDVPKRPYLVRLEVAIRLEREVGARKHTLRGLDSGVQRNADAIGRAKARFLALLHRATDGRVEVVHSEESEELLIRTVVLLRVVKELPLVLVDLQNLVPKGGLRHRSGRSILFVYIRASRTSDACLPSGWMSLYFVAPAGRRVCDKTEYKARPGACPLIPTWQHFPSSSGMARTRTRKQKWRPKAQDKHEGLQPG
ncbi:hypothetical protein OF83DRAFT_1153918, partial [Amylostereum chailletii]